MTVRILFEKSEVEHWDALLSILALQLHQNFTFNFCCSRFDCFELLLAGGTREECWVLLLDRVQESVTVGFSSFAVVNLDIV